MGAWVYIFVSDDAKGISRIGHTTQLPQKRAKDVSQAHKMQWSVFLEKGYATKATAKAVEALAHALLQDRPANLATKTRTKKGETTHEDCFKCVPEVAEAVIFKAERIVANAIEMDELRNDGSIVGQSYALS